MVSGVAQPAKVPCLIVWYAVIQVGIGLKCNMVCYSTLMWGMCGRELFDINALVDEPSGRGWRA